jgi:hypothetical protein
MPFVQRQAVDADRRTVSALVLCPLLVVTFDAQAAQRAGHELIKIALVRFDVVRDSRGCRYASLLAVLTERKLLQLMRTTTAPTCVIVPGTPWAISKRHQTTSQERLEAADALVRHSQSQRAPSAEGETRDRLRKEKNRARRVSTPRPTVPPVQQRKNARL